MCLREDLGFKFEWTKEKCVTIINCLWIINDATTWLPITKATFRARLKQQHVTTVSPFFYKIKIYCKLIFLNVKNKFLKNNLRPNTPFQSRSCFTQEIMARLSSTPTLSHMDKGRPSASHQNVIQTREFYFSLDLHMVHIIPIHYTHHTRISNRCEWWKW